MTSDSKGEVRFECLRCGKLSTLDNLHAVQPCCGRCGSKTGVLGEIGQGSREDRASRAARPAGDQKGELKFDCLTCGHTTMLARPGERRPQCPHCGSLSGVLIGSPPPG